MLFSILLICNLTRPILFSVSFSEEELEKKKWKAEDLWICTWRILFAFDVYDFFFSFSFSFLSFYFLGDKNLVKMEPLVKNEGLFG